MENALMSPKNKKKYKLESEKILDLCGGTGAWSRLYKESGYEVINVDILNGLDVRTYNPPPNVYGVLAAPPCSPNAEQLALGLGKALERRVIHPPVTKRKQRSLPGRRHLTV